MPGDVMIDGAQPALPQQPLQQPGGYGPRGEVSEEDKKLAQDYQKRIEDTLSRPTVKKVFKEFEKNRQRLRGFEPEDGSGEKKRLRTNLYFSNLAAIRPQIYAKDPEFSVAPKKGVPPDRLPLVTKFCETAEAVLTQLVVEDCKLKKRSKRLITSCFTTAVGWWKQSWQEKLGQDPQIQNRLDDTQDNINRLEMQRAQLEDPQACSDMDLQLAKMRETLAGLQTPAEIVVSRGLTLDFVASEDVIILDSSVQEIAEYERGSAIAHRIWMTRAKYRETFKHNPEKAKTYIQDGPDGNQSNAPAPGTGTKDSDLLCVFEIWDKDQNRVHTICMGVEGFCRPSFSPDWTPRRWYPFYLLMWNEIDGFMYPVSDVELIKPLVDEYNEARNDLVKDRRDTRPVTVVRKGGSLTDKDVENFRNRDGNDIIAVEGTGQAPLSNDIQAVQFGSIDPRNYDTAPSRADIEQIVGGGDASRGSVLQAKTATEAEILSQGLRGRSAERTDGIEDLLSELGTGSLQICLRKLTAQEVQRIAGPEAQWPQLDIEDIFDMVTVQVRAGSTGRPDRLQEQDRWTKLQPVIKETVMTVAELYAKGQVQLGQALVEMLRETLRRFDERIDLDTYLPKPPEEGEVDPATLQQENLQLKQQVKELMTQMSDLKVEIEKANISAATSIATSANPMLAAQAFGTAMQVVKTGESPAETPPPMAQDPGTPMPQEQATEQLPI